MSVYFNDNDPTAAAWLRELYPAATVDSRSITDVSPDDLVGYRRAHFFGGIGGWQYALDLADWPAEREVWTGSCPCQPFSAAGKAAGLGDDRHLWPAFRHLIAVRRPAVCFGEQVASKDGRWWLAGVRADLEALGYAVGAADLCAAGVSAPHIRQRLYWVAHTTGVRYQQRIVVNKAGARSQAQVNGQPQRRGRDDLTNGSDDSGLADADGRQSSDGDLQRSGQHGQRAQDGGAGCRMEHPAGHGREQRRAEPGGRGAGPRRDPGGLADAQRDDGRADEPGRRPTGRGAAGRVGAGAGRVGNSERDRRQEPDARQSTWRPGSPNPWADARLILCADGRYRRISPEPALFPLSPRLPGRVGLLRGAGNSIVAPLAAQFIQAFLEAETMLAAHAVGQEAV